MGSFAGRRAGRGESVTTEEAQLKVEELVRRYFAGATVRWCETNQVKPPYPFVALKLTDVSHFLHPDESGETEISQRYYCTGRIALNLYTGGRKGTGKPGMSAPPPRNTAVSDLQSFIRYLGSDAGQDFWRCTIFVCRRREARWMSALCSTMLNMSIGQCRSFPSVLWKMCMDIPVQHHRQGRTALYRHRAGEAPASKLLTQAVGLKVQK